MNGVLRRISSCIGVTILLFGVLVGGCTTQETPTTPETPATQEKPKTPETPTTPETPATQETPTTPKTPANQETPTTRIVMDKEGNPIEIPYNVERVAPQIGAMAHMTALLGCSDRLVCTAFGNTNPYFYQVFPRAADANPKGLRTSSVEEIIASKAQVLYGPITDEATIAQLKAAGIAVVPLNTFATIQEMEDNIRKIAEILGGEAPARAEAFCKYYEEQIDYVTKKTENVRKVKICSLFYSGGKYTTINSVDICSVYITAAGGINVAGHVQFAGGAFSGSCNIEDVIKWNPEIIITSTTSGKTQILADPTLKTVQAVRDGKVYVVPTGTYLWSVRSAEGAMMPLWLAKTMHPDVFYDLDMYRVVRDYYKMFYGYVVPDNEIFAILAGNQQ
jgi:iron complex transport system substrate-binding protein